MPDQATLEALRDAFWGFYLLTLSLVAARVLWTWARGRAWWDLARCAAALALASLAQWAIERELGPGGYLLGHHHLAINALVFVAVVSPPLRYWQAVLGALVLVAMVTNGLWIFNPEFGRWHWLANILIGFAKCATLLLWAGGPRLEHLARMVRRRLRDGAARLVPALAAGELAR